MSKFYTNIKTFGNSILVRGVENGKRFQRKEEFFPTVYVSSKKETEWKTLYGEYVSEVKPGSISDTKEFIKKYSDIDNFSVFGQTDYSKQYISDNYPGEIKFDKSLLKIISLDIETTTEHGMTIDEMIRDPKESITLISLIDSKTKVITTFGTKPWTAPDQNGPYIECQNEAQLLREFLIHWSSDYPDIASGWNTNGFDFPYLIKRMARVLGDTYPSKLSPWNKIRERNFFDANGNPKISYDIDGISLLDYLELFKKFGYIQTDDNKLDTVAEVVLGENKKENPGTSFKDFYTNHWNIFVEYNRHDSRLVDMLDEKLKLIDLAITLAFYAKINFDEVYGPVGMWDCIIYNYLKDKNIVIPPKKNNSTNVEFEGAYVQDPVIGYHKWVASFDLASLYPHLIMNYNISPETITDIRIDCSVDALLDKSIDTSFTKEYNVALTANGWCYRRDVRGFLPELMDNLYKDRSRYKKEMLKLEQQLESDKNNITLQNDIARLNSLQMAIKIALNSLYGALGNIHFRYFDLRMAESITLSGQLSNRWNANMLDSYFNKVNKTDGVKYTIAGDTDSNYLSLETVVENTCAGKTTEQKIQFMDKLCSNVIQPMIDTSYQKLADYMNAYEQKMIMKREVLADAGVFVAKKRYFLRVHNSEGVQYAEPKLKVIGLELVKTSTPKVCRKVLKDSLHIILDGGVDNLKSYVRDFKDKFETLDPVEIGRPSGVNGMSKFKDKDNVCIKGTPIHVRGSLWHNALIEKHNLKLSYEPILDSDKIKYVYLRTPNPINQNIIAFKSSLPMEFNLNNYIDRDTQFEKVFLNPLQIMVEPLGWNLDDSANLEDFFG